MTGWRLGWMCSLALWVGLCLYGAAGVAGANPVGRAYLAVSGEDRVVALDVSKGRVLFSLVTDDCPEELLVSRSGKVLFVSNKEARTVQAFDLVHKTMVARYRVPGKPGGLTLDKAGKTLSVSEVENNHVTIIELDTTVERLVGSMNRNWPIYVQRWVAEARNKGVLGWGSFGVHLPRVLRTKTVPKRERQEYFSGPVSTSIQARLELPGTRTFVAIDDKAARLYVAGSDKNRVLYHIALPEKPAMILLDGSGRYVFAALRKKNSVAVVDMKERRVVQLVRVGRSPVRLLSLKSNGSYWIYVTCIDDNRVAVFDAITHRVIAWILVGRGAQGAFYCRA